MLLRLLLLLPELCEPSPSDSRSTVSKAGSEAETRPRASPLDVAGANDPSFTPFGPRGANGRSIGAAQARRGNTFASRV